jgi:RNA polymerase sigma factor (sigma-70 family)
MSPNEPSSHPVGESPRAATETDRELLQRFIKSRDERAFEALVRLHGPLVLGVCRRIVGHHHDAEEAFQATFLVLARKAATVRPPEMVANWLYGVACRTALKTRAAAARRRAKEVQLTVIPELKASPTERWEEIASLLDRELRRLPDKFRAAVVCCDLEGRSRQEAALQLGCPEGTLKARLTRGRSILAQRLARQGVVLSAGALAAIVTQNAASAAVPAALAASTAKAGALAAVKVASTAALGSKVAALGKRVVKPAFSVKGAIVAAVAGATVAAAFLIGSVNKTADQAAGLTLPADVRTALEENAAQLSPISATFTVRQEHLTAKDPLARAAREEQCKVIWQDGKLYVSHQVPIGPAGAANGTFLNEFTCDGRVFSIGFAPSGPSDKASSSAIKPRTAGRQAMANRGLTKQSAAQAHRSLPDGIASINLYLRADVAGFVIGPASPSAAASAGIAEQKLAAASAVLDLLGRGAKLLSIENVPLDGKPCLRVELDAEYLVRRNAQATDLDQRRKELAGSGLSAKLQRTVIDRILRQRSLPASRHFIYYLDPGLHYAVRRLEQRYGGETLLARIDCSQFQQIPGRPLWLPRRVVSEIYDSDKQEAAPSCEPSWSKNIDVSAIDGRRVSEETFSLDDKYNEPGTVVRDETDPAAAKLASGAVSYIIPARLEDLPGVIERARRSKNLEPRGSQPSRR